MATTLTIRDETTGGEPAHEFTVDLLTETLTIRELIRSRVFQEVKDHNAKQPEHFRGLIQPTDAEKTLNGYKLKNKRMIDWQPQFDKATEAFEKNQIVVLVDDRQAESLDEQITVGPETKVTFLRLVMLVGG